MTPGPEDPSRRLRRNAIANMAGRGASALLWLAVTPYALQRLGHERFGVWALFFALSGYAGMLDLGMAGGVGRFVALAVAREDRHEARRVIMRSLLSSLGLGLVWSLACVLARGPFVHVFHVPAALVPEVHVSLAVFSLSLLVFSVAQVLQWSLMGFQRFDVWNLCFVSGLVVNVGVLVAGLALGWGLIAAAAAAVAGNATVGLLAIRAVRSCLNGIPIAAAPRPGTTWRDLLGFGARVQASNLFGVGQMQAGKVMVGVIGRLLWVTQFELAFRVTNALWSMSVLIQGAAYPAAARAHELGGKAPVREVYEWCCRWTYVVAGWVLGLAWLLAPALYHGWLGVPHPEVVEPARWLAIAFAACTLGGPGDAVCRGIGAPGLEVGRWGIALAVNVGLGLWLIPQFGASGAAIAMAVSFAAGTAFLLVTLHRRIEYSNRAWLLRIMLPRLAPAAVIAMLLRLGLDRWPIDSRIESIAVCVIGAAAYTVLFVAAVWPTGDPIAVWSRARAWLAHKTAGTLAAR